MKKITIGTLFVIAITVLLVAGLLIPATTASADGGLTPPNQEGSYDVGHYSIWFNVDGFGLYKAKIRYPAKWDGWLAAKDMSDGPYPGIVMAGGSLQTEWMMEWAPEHLTSHGYITACITPPNTLSMETAQWAEGLNKAIKKIRTENTRWLSPMKHILDANSIGVLGYSMGGAGAIEAAAVNPEIDVVVGLAPGADEGDLASYFESTKAACQNITVPIQMQVGSNDGNVLPEWIDGYYNLIPNTTVKEQLVITGANHFQFFDPCSAEILSALMAIFGMDNAATISVEAQHAISKGYFTAWFNYYLKGNTNYETYIFGAEAQADLDSGILTALEYNLTYCNKHANLMILYQNLKSLFVQ